jgi:hypothetical protein
VVHREEALQAARQEEDHQAAARRSEVPRAVHRGVARLEAPWAVHREEDLPWVGPPWAARPLAARRSEVRPSVHSRLALAG